MLFHPIPLHKIYIFFHQSHTMVRLNLRFHPCQTFWKQKEHNWYTGTLTGGSDGCSHGGEVMSSGGYLLDIFGWFERSNECNISSHLLRHFIGPSTFCWLNGYPQHFDGSILRVQSTWAIPMVMESCFCRGNSQETWWKMPEKEGRDHWRTNFQQVSLWLSGLFVKGIINEHLQSTIFGWWFQTCFDFMNPFWQKKHFFLRAYLFSWLMVSWGWKITVKRKSIKSDSSNSLQDSSDLTSMKVCHFRVWEASASYSVCWKEPSITGSSGSSLNAPSQTEAEMEVVYIFALGNIYTPYMNKWNS